ncbi:MAG: hypothetical protein JF612_12450 [Planctomycetia bacterium]|nr:hypothetical protein [Planctomycetia bacterium]
MQPSEALGIAAQVAVTLAGFAGIVVVFRPDSVHRWSPLDKLRLQLLLTNSALPLAESLLGMLLLTFDSPPASIWRWCSGVSFSAQVLVFVYMRNPRRRLFTRADMPAVNKHLFYGIAVIATVATALQAVNFSAWNCFWPFFAIIFVHLVAALAQFVRMVLLPPDSSE